jgi:hypothetical protein
LGTKFNEFIESISRKYESMKEEAAVLVENGKAKADEALEG